MDQLMNKSDDTSIVATKKETANVVEDMANAYKLAKVMCQAQVIPDTYRNKPADCMIAIDMANRMGVSPLMVMQNLYVVKGKPSWSGQACMSFIQSNPEFKNVTPVYVGEPNTDQRGCYIQAIRVADNAIVKGTCVTMAMAKAEGWTKNPKWFSMTDQMLGYRASSFFARIYCPSVLMGVSVEGEVEDVSASKNRKVEDVLC